ncbi:MAG: cardiolipin synthase [Saonia sp.]
MQTILVLIYIASTLWAIISIIFHGSRPTKSVSWVLAALALPFAGPILYYLFGVNRRKFKLYKLKRTEQRKLYDETYHEIVHTEFENEFESQKNFKLAKLIKNSSLLSPYRGNRVTLLNGGKETFEAEFKAITAAKKFIHLQYYIIEQGEVVDTLYELFKAKIAEGVTIRMIYDSFGSYSLRGKSIARFRDIGVKAYPIMPIRFGNLLFTLNYRNHRKILIVDGVLGFVGGVNLSDKYIKNISNLGIWEDFHLKIEGPVVNSLHRVFIKDYHFAGEEDILLQDKYLPENPTIGDSTVQMVASGPDSKHPTILQQYLAMINTAERCIQIANPYFIPGTSILEALKMAALSGVEVKLLIPKKSDSLLARLSMYSNFEQLLAVGIKIFLRNDFSHSKVIVIDKEVASVGSGNFDYRSFEHNFETNAMLYDEKLATTIAQALNAQCSEDIRLDYESFRNRSPWQKFLEGLAKFFSPLL